MQHERPRQRSSPGVPSLEEGGHERAGGPHGLRPGWNRGRRGAFVCFPASSAAVSKRPPGEVTGLYCDEVVEARMRRARRPRSLKSTRPSSAAAASLAARSIASSSTGAAAAAS